MDRPKVSPEVVGMVHAFAITRDEIAEVIDRRVAKTYAEAYERGVVDGAQLAVALKGETFSNGIAFECHRRLVKKEAP